MASIPPKSCGICRVAEKINNNMRKHIIIYSFIYLFLFEISSIFLRNRENYANYWYPLLTQLFLSVIFYNIFLLRDRLKFCLRKSIVVFTLFLYYFFGLSTIVFQFCNSTYNQIISYGLLTIVFITLLLTIIQDKK
jgi:hypothetical protein